MDEINSQVVENKSYLLFLGTLWIIWCFPYYEVLKQVAFMKYKSILILIYFFKKTMPSNLA